TFRDHALARSRRGLGGNQRLFPDEALRRSFHLREQGGVLREWHGARPARPALLLRRDQMPAPLGGDAARVDLVDRAVVPDIAVAIRAMLWTVAADVTAGHDHALEADMEMAEREKAGSCPRVLDIEPVEQPAAIGTVLPVIDRANLDLDGFVRCARE